MQTLKFLGVGSAFNTKEGNTSAYIKHEDTLILIDCGESVFSKMIQEKLLDNIKDIYVLITHLHSDHVGSLSSLIFYCYYKLGIKVKVYFEDLGIEQLTLLLRIQGNKVGEHYELIDMFNTNNEFNFVPIRTRHDDNMFCYGYHINYKNKSIYYSGDSNEIPTIVLNDFIEGKIDGFYQDTCLADYEGNVHLSLRKLCEYIPKELRYKVYCIHMDCSELIDKAEEEGFNVVCAEDKKEEIQREKLRKKIKYEIKYDETMQELENKINDYNNKLDSMEENASEYMNLLSKVCKLEWQRIKLHELLSNKLRESSKTEKTKDN